MKLFRATYHVHIFKSNETERRASIVIAENEFHVLDILKEYHNSFIVFNLLIKELPLEKGVGVLSTELYN